MTVVGCVVVVTVVSGTAVILDSLVTVGVGAPVFVDPLLEVMIG